MGSYSAENDILISRIKTGDEGAREELITKNMKLVYHICSRFSERGAQTEDLCQIGALGLIRAARDFDPSYGVKFSTYAVPLIIGEIKRYFRDFSMIKASRGLKELAQKAQRASNELTLTLGREPKIGEIAERLGVESELIASAFDAVRPPQSLNAPLFDDNGATLEAVLASDDSEDALLDKLALRTELSRLPERERILIDLRFFHELTQAETASFMGISQVSVSRLERKILKKLREQIKNQ